MKYILIVFTVILIFLLNNLSLCQAQDFTEQELRQTNLQNMITLLKIAEQNLSLGCMSYNNPAPNTYGWQWYIENARFWLNQVKAGLEQKHLNDLILKTDLTGVQAGLASLIQEPELTNASIPDQIIQAKNKLNELIQKLERILNKESAAYHFHLPISSSILWRAINFALDF